MKCRFKGVSRDARTNRWKAQLFIAGKNRNLGYFDSEEDAARMWDTARVRLGEFFESPVPDLNFGFEQLNDPHAVQWLRERLELEGATKFDLAATAILAPGAECCVTQDRAPHDGEPVEIRRARLSAEATRLNQRLAKVLAELNQTFFSK